MASLAWTVAIVLTGGFERHVFGITLKSREPLRALVAATAGLLLYACAAGFRRTCAAWMTRVREFDTQTMAVALAGGTFALGIAYATTAAVGPDQYGYVSQADLWLQGNPVVPQPWADVVPWPEGGATFAPLGYAARHENGASAAIVPTYSPGLPLLMAALAKAGGRAALFAVVPILGALLVLATYGIGSRIGLPPYGLAAAWLVATSPAFLFMLMLPMSDVPAAALWAAATYFVLGRTARDAAFAGVSGAAAILVRPNLVPLATPLAAWLLFGSSGMDFKARRDRLVAFALTTAIGPCAIAVIYLRLYGSPLTSGYGSLGPLFSPAHILPNLRRYVGWFTDTQTPLAIAGMVAAVCPVRMLWPHVRDRRILIVFFAMLVVVWASYLPYLEFDGWPFLRFVLPSWPFIMVGVAAVLGAIARRRGPVVALAMVWVTFMLGANGLQIAQFRGAFNLWRNDRRFVDVAQRIRAVTGDSSIVYTMYQSGSIRYYAGRQTFRFDSLRPDWLDRSIEWFASRGVHPYLAFADADELNDFKAHFPQQSALRRLDDSLIFTYADQGVTYFSFYDLLPLAPHTARRETSGDLARLRSAPPLPLPPLALRTDMSREKP